MMRVDHLARNDRVQSFPEGVKPDRMRNGVRSVAPQQRSYFDCFGKLSTKGLKSSSDMNSA